MSMNPSLSASTETGEALKKRLLSKREELVNDLQKNREVSDETVDESAQDMADRATSSYTREFAYSLSEADRKVLILIDEALDRLSDATFGKCLNCNASVEDKRLNAVPWARFCLECQEQHDRGLI